MRAARRQVERGHAVVNGGARARDALERTVITADRVLGKLEEIAFSNKNSTAQMKALELLGKHLGLWEKPTAENDEALSKLDEVLGKIEGGF